MSGVSGGTGGRRSGLLARLAAVPLRWLGLSAGAAALAVSGIFGGLDGTHQPKLPTVDVAAVNRGDPWDVTVTRARLISELPGHKPRTAGGTWLGVVATVEITADESRTDVKDILRLPGVNGPTGEEPEHVVLMRDATEQVQLNPGMPEQVAFIWEWSTGITPPAELAVEIYGKTYRQDSLSNAMTWLDPEPRAQVHVPVEDRRG